MRSMAQSISSRVMMSGGANRIMLKGVSFESTPRSKRASQQRLADNQYVGVNVVVILHEEPAGAPQPGLNLVVDKQDVVPLANFRSACQIARRRDDYPTFALDRFDQEGHGVRRDGRF